MISVHSIESYLQLSTNGTRQVEELSAQQLTSCVPNPLKCGGNGGCSGSVPQLAFQYTQAFGLVKESDYPYISGNVRLLTFIFILIDNKKENSNISVGRYWNLWHWRKLWTQASRCHCNPTWIRKLAKQQLWSCDGAFGHQRTIVSFSGCLWMECLLGWSLRFLWLQPKHWVKPW